MSLDISLICECCGCEVYESNITHNLGKMAKAAGIYKEVWRPEEVGILKAADMMSILSAGIEELKNNPEIYKKYNDPDGWGLYKHFVPFLEGYLSACNKFPEATIEANK